MCHVLCEKSVCGASKNQCVGGGCGAAEGDWRMKKEKKMGEEEWKSEGTRKVVMGC